MFMLQYLCDESSAVQQQCDRGHELEEPDHTHGHSHARVHSGVHPESSALFCGHSLSVGRKLVLMSDPLRITVPTLTVIYRDL